MTGGAYKAGDRPKLIVSVKDWQEARAILAEIEREMQSGRRRSPYRRALNAMAAQDLNTGGSS